MSLGRFASKAPKAPEVSTVVADVNDIVIAAHQIAETKWYDVYPNQDMSAHDRTAWLLEHFHAIIAMMRDVDESLSTIETLNMPEQQDALEKALQTLDEQRELIEHLLAYMTPLLPQIEA